VDRGQGSKAIGEKKEANQRLRTTEIDLFYAKKKKTREGHRSITKSAKRLYRE